MKTFACVLTLSMCVLCGTPAVAGDGDISAETLSALGLSSLQTLTPEQGLEVRGQSSSFAMTIGTGLIFGQLVSQDTKNFLVGSDVNMVQSNAETTDSLGHSLAIKDHVSFVDLELYGVGKAVGSVGGQGMALGGGLHLPHGFQIPGLD